MHATMPPPSIHYAAIGPRFIPTMRALTYDRGAMRVYLHLMEHADAENVVHQTAKSIAAAVRVSPGNVGRATRGLRDRGFVNFLWRGNTVAYVLDPEAVWKGAPENRDACVFGRKLRAPLASLRVAS